MLGRVMLLCGARDGLLCGRQSIQLPSCASLFRISWDVCLGECTEWAEGTRIDRTLSVTACWRLLCVTTGDSYYPVHSGCLSACVSASVSASQAPTVWTATINQDHLGSHLSTQSHKNTAFLCSIGGKKLPIACKSLNLVEEYLFMAGPMTWCQHIYSTQSVSSNSINRTWNTKILAMKLPMMWYGCFRAISWNFHETLVECGTCACCMRSCVWVFWYSVLYSVPLFQCSTVLVQCTGTVLVQCTTVPV